MTYEGLSQAAIEAKAVPPGNHAEATERLATKLRVNISAAITWINRHQTLGRTNVGPFNASPYAHLPWLRGLLCDMLTLK